MNTVESDGSIGVPGGKWELAVDGLSWDNVLSREFLEEVSAPLPAAPHVLKAGHIEWGSDAYRIRFKVLEIDEEAAAALPTGSASDLDGAVTETFWAMPNGMKRRGAVRAHVDAALRVLGSSALIAREASLGHRRTGPPPRRARKTREPSDPKYTLEDALPDTAL